GISFSGVAKKNKQIIIIIEVVFVIQSQKNSYHTLRAEQRRAHLFHQAQLLKQGLPDVVFLHELSEYGGNWGILPALPLLAEGYCWSSSWIFFLEEETIVDLDRLLQVLSRFTSGRVSLELALIFYLACLFDSCATGNIIALYIWEEGRGPALINVREFCSELHGSPNTNHCASAVNTYIPSCGNPVKKEELFVAVKTCQKFHRDRVPVVKKTWAKDAALLEYYSDAADPAIPTVDLRVPNTGRGHCAKTFSILRRFASGGVTRAPWLLIVDDDTLIRNLFHFVMIVIIHRALSYSLRKQHVFGFVSMVFSREAVQRMLSSGCGCYSPDAPDDMVLGMCLNTLGIPVTHSPQFHQARPDDYSKQLLLRQSPVSFHKHWNINPVAVYQRWLMDTEEPFQQLFGRKHRQEL
uniref:Beta 3-glucosyltransferase b n=1 Tax=Astyanax mexicanus TaxID=7994 RepID=A0A8B9H058_ASTMX